MTCPYQSGHYSVVILQEKYSHLCAKYQHAKSKISSLKLSSHLLAEQLITRDEQYSSYLAQLREKFLQLESELVDTQRRAGLPVRLPYDQEAARNLLSPPDELKRQPFLPAVSVDVSDSEEDITAELDQAVPQHSLLSHQAARHRAELAHKGGLGSRSRPSLEGVKTQLSSSSLTDTDQVEPVSVVTSVETILLPGPTTATTVDLTPTSPTNGAVRTSSSFQDQLKSTLEARKRSLDGEQSQPEHCSHSFNLPLSESQPATYKGQLYHSYHCYHSYRNYQRYLRVDNCPRH